MRAYWLLWGLLFFAGKPCRTQQAASAAPATQAPSSLVRPALDSVARAGSAVDLNRWKGPNATREGVDANLASIQKDLETTLPPLLTAADAAPNAASASLPVLLNLDALYSVLLRVSVAAHTGAPRDEAAAIDQATTLLDSARRDLGDAVLRSAKAAEQQVTELQTTVHQQEAAMQQVQQPVKPASTTKPKKKMSGGTAR